MKKTMKLDRPIVVNDEVIIREGTVIEVITEEAGEEQVATQKVQRPSTRSKKSRARTLAKKRGDTALKKAESRRTPKQEAALRGEDDRVIALAQHLGLDEGEYSDIDVSSYDETMLEYGRQEYYVLSDREADDKAKEFVRNLLDEMGLDSFTDSFREQILSQFVDTDRFWRDARMDLDNWFHEEPESYSSFFEDQEKAMAEALLEAIKELNRDAVQWLSDYANIDEEDFMDEDTGVFDEAAFVKAAQQELLSADIDDIIGGLKAAGKIEEFVDAAVQEYIDQYDSPAEWLEELGYEGESLMDQLRPYVDLEAVVQEVIDVDGRALQLAGYDHEENEENVNGETYFIYRWN